MRQAREPAAPPDVMVAQGRAEGCSDLRRMDRYVGRVRKRRRQGGKSQAYLVRQAYQEGALVSKGQLLFEIDPRPFQAALDQAEGQLAQATAQLANAEAVQVRTQLDVERYTPLAKEQAASQQDLDTPLRITWRRKPPWRPPRLKSRRRGCCRNRKTQPWLTRLTAPISGIAGQAQLQVGALVNPSSTPVTTVSTLDPIRDYFTVSEQDYIELQKQFASSDRQRWKLQLILTDGTIYPTKAPFYFAGPRSRSKHGRDPTGGALSNPGNVLRPGQYGKVRAVVRIEKGALLSLSLLSQSCKATIRLTLSGRTARSLIRPVKVGDRIGTMVDYPRRTEAR